MVSLSIQQVDLINTQRTGLSAARNRLWRSGFTLSLASLKKRKLTPSIKRRCFTALYSITTPLHHPTSNCVSAAYRIQKSLLCARVPRALSDIINQRMACLPSYVPQYWTSAQVQHVAFVMSKVFRDLLLCESSLVRLLPVPVVAAIIEVLSTEPNARQSSWWWGKERCQLVRKRAVELCGQHVDEDALAKLRATLVLLVFVIRHASLLSPCALDDPSYPFGEKGERERIYLSGEEVAKLITMLKAVGWADIAEELEFDLKFQQDVVRVNTEGDQRIAEHCHFSEEEQQVIVTCATSVIVRLSKLVKVMGLVARQVTSNIQFMGLVRKTTDESKHVAIPFVLAQLFSGNAELIYSAEAARKLSNDIQSNISDRGAVIASSLNHAANDGTIDGSLDEKPADPTTYFEAFDGNDCTDANVKSSLQELSSCATEQDLVPRNEAPSLKTLPQPITQQRDEPQQNNFAPRKKGVGPAGNFERTAGTAARAAIHVPALIDYSDSFSSEGDPQHNAMGIEREGQWRDSQTNVGTLCNEDSEQSAHTTPGADQQKCQNTLTFVANDADGEASLRVQTVQLDGSALPKQLRGGRNRRALAQREAVQHNDLIFPTPTADSDNRPALPHEKEMQQERPFQYMSQTQAGSSSSRKKKLSQSLQVVKKLGSHASLLPPKSLPQTQFMREQSSGKKVKSANDVRGTRSIESGKHLVSVPMASTDEGQITESVVRTLSNHDPKPTILFQEFGPSRDTFQHKINRGSVLESEQLRRRRTALAARAKSLEEESDSESVKDIVFHFTSSETQAADESISPESMITPQQKRGRKTSAPRRRKVDKDFEVEIIPHDPAPTHVEEVFSNNNTKALDTRSSSSCFGMQRSRNSRLVRKRRVLDPEFSEVDEGENEGKDGASNRGIEHDDQRLPVHPNPSLESKHRADHRQTLTAGGKKKRRHFSYDLRSSHDDDDAKGSDVQMSTRQFSNGAVVVSDNQHSLRTNTEREKQTATLRAPVTGDELDKTGNATVLGSLSRLAEGSVSESDAETDSVELMAT